MAAPPTAPRKAAADTSSVHENVYRELRRRLLTGGFLPGRPVTLRGIADELGVSPMPVRGAVARLMAERALELQDNRRVQVPAMTQKKFEQIIFVRQQLELELCARAFAQIDAKALGGIDAADEQIPRALAAGDIEGYMRWNCEFHFAIYRCSEADILLALLESVWLQFAPFMRVVYGRLGTEAMIDEHKNARDAIRAGDKAGLVAAISADIMQGMCIIGEDVLAGRSPTTSKSARAANS